MEKLNVHQNGQWDLVKSRDTQGYKVKHKSTVDGKSIYSITHTEHGNVGHAVLDHSNMTVSPTVHDKFKNDLSGIGRSVRAFHTARNA